MRCVGKQRLLPLGTLPCPKSGWPDFCYLLVVVSIAGYASYSALMKLFLHKIFFSYFLSKCKQKEKPVTTNLKGTINNYDNNGVI